MSNAPRPLRADFGRARLSVERGRLSLIGSRGMLSLSVDPFGSAGTRIIGCFGSAKIVALVSHSSGAAPGALLFWVAAALARPLERILSDVWIALWTSSF